MSTGDVAGPLEAVRGSWDELVSAALIGTDRRASVPDPALAPGTDPSRALLQQAMLASILILTGPQPAPYDGPLPEPRPADDRPLIPGPAQLRLRTMLDARSKDLVEWLTAVSSRGRRVPMSAMPGLLEAARADVSIRSALAEVLGERGRWLARQNPAWRYLLREPVGPLRPEDWDGPDPDARIAYANGLYAADPAAARELLRNSWPTLTAATKVHLLGVVERYGTKADQPFVAGLSQDSSKQVRDQVRSLSAQLGRRAEDTWQRPSPERFVTDVAQLAGSENLSRQIHTFAMQRALERWPLEGARAVLALLVDCSREQIPVPGEAADDKLRVRNRQAAELLARVLADCAPAELHPDVQRVVQDQNEDVAAGRVHHLDFTALLAVLGLRAEMHAELTASDDAAPGQD